MQVSAEFLTYMSVIAAISPLIMQALKKALPLPKNYVPLITAGVGIILALPAFPFIDISLSERIWAGFISGIGGTGLFEAVRQDKRGRTK